MNPILSTPSLVSIPSELSRLLYLKLSKCILKVAIQLHCNTNSKAFPSFSRIINYE